MTSSFTFVFHLPVLQLLENEQKNYDSMSPTHRTLAVDGVGQASSAAPGSALWHSGGHDDVGQDNSHASQLQSQQSRSCSRRYRKLKQFYAFLLHFVAFLFKGSYVITLIIMMVREAQMDSDVSGV